LRRIPEKVSFCFVWIIAHQDNVETLRGFFLFYADDTWGHFFRS